MSFRYPDASAEARPTLQGVSFTAEPGQHVAFVGPSGAGKTTVLYLTPRMYEASGGAVLFAGEDVRRLTQESIIDNVGIVSQETYLFHASIRENLRYAKPDATRCRARRGVPRREHPPRHRDASSTGYDTIVGERGYRLSGGEKQRIAIARVLLKDPPVLLLDEATSALDTVSERVVQEALDAAARGRTTLSIAHRLSTVHRRRRHPCRGRRPHRRVGHPHRAPRARRALLRARGAAARLVPHPRDRVLAGRSRGV